jgi:fatty acid desaturase
MLPNRSVVDWRAYKNDRASEPRSFIESRAYRAWVFETLGGGNAWSDDVEQVSESAMRRLLARRRGELGPSWHRAALTMLKTALLVGLPLYAATYFVRHALLWVVPVALLLAGGAVYGVMAIVHDLAHSSFFPNKRANAVLGYLLAPLVLLEFDSFRASHLGHHRFSQSTADPKRFGTALSPDAHLPDYRTVDQMPWLTRPFVWLALSLSRLPLRIRHVLYLVFTMAFMSGAVLFFAGEFALPGRNWRRPATWLAFFGSAATGALLYWVSPTLLALYASALVIGYGFVFMVFAGHLSPNQVSWLTHRRASFADALNVSDVRCGALLRWLGNGFSEFHSTHHLVPSIPCYHLAEAAEMAREELGPVRAPAIDMLDAQSCVLLWDNLVRSCALSNDEAYEQTPVAAMRNVLPLQGRG